MGPRCVIRAVNGRPEMPFRLRSLLLLFACAPYLSAAHGMERAGDATRLFELEQHAKAVTALDTEILSSIEATPSEERFYLYWTHNHLTGSWAQVEYLQSRLELSLEAQSYPDEESIRTTVRDQAEFVRWELGQAIDDLAQTTPEIKPLDYPWINEAVRSLLTEIRTTVDRLRTDQCAYVPCVVGP
jgi:hypothetical protein